MGAPGLILGPRIDFERKWCSKTDFLTIFITKIVASFCQNMPLQNLRKVTFSRFCPLPYRWFRPRNRLAPPEPKTRILGGVPGRPGSTRGGLFWDRAPPWALERVAGNLFRPPKKVDFLPFHPGAGGRWRGWGKIRFWLFGAPAKKRGPTIGPPFKK